MISAANALADLKWIFNTPSLLQRDLPDFPSNILQSHELNQLAADFKVKLDTTDFEHKLRKFLDEKFEGSTLLGKYFEALIEFIIREDEQLELIYHNEQLIVDKRTLGELDFVFYDRSNGQLIHLECALKYYLGHHESRDLQNWIGPNKRDTLYNKVEKLKEQSAWLQDKGIRSHFEALPPDTPVRSYCLLLGYLIPPNHATELRPHHANRLEHSITWISATEFIEKQSNHRYALIPKINWLSPKNRVQLSTPAEHDELISICRKIENGEHYAIWVQREDGKDMFIAG